MRCGPRVRIVTPKDKPRADLERVARAVQESGVRILLDKRDPRITGWTLGTRYDYDRRVIIIVVNDDLDLGVTISRLREWVMLLAHEFGHALQHRAYEASRSGSTPRAWVDYYVARQRAYERDAWHIGFGFLRCLGIEVEPNDLAYAGACLRTYGTTL